MESAVRRGEKCVPIPCSRIGLDLVIVTDMLVAVLNTCSKEELEESDEEVLPQPSQLEDSAERRKVIKNKILAVGRMARVFALLRFVASHFLQCGVTHPCLIPQRRVGKGGRVEEHNRICQIAIWNTRVGHRRHQGCHFRIRRRVRLSFPFPTRAYPRLDENRISKTNACRPSYLTLKKPRRSSPNTRTRNRSRRPPLSVISPYPPLGLSKRASKRRYRLPHSRRRRATRAWADLRRQRRPRRRRARYRSGDDTDDKRVWARRGRVRRRGDGVWRARFR